MGEATRRALAVVASICVLGVPSTGHAEFVSCGLTYQAKAWSVLYKRLTGTGTITCSNGESAEVVVSLHGGGVTFGYSDMQGSGVFSDVRDLSETLGTYGAFEGHAGFVKSIDGRVLTKGLVFLSQSSRGRGFNLGFAFGGLSIRRR